jgi:pimeloyl-ACP methyl ester carboxylesterase
MGTGPDVFLLHPTPVNHAFWLPVAEQLADRYRLVLPDLRGHGQSSLGSGPVTVEKLARDLHAILLTEKTTRAAFIGCSIGTSVLYEYWRRFPQEVAALVLTCGKPQPDNDANRERRHAWMQEARGPGGLAKFFDAMANTLVGPTSARSHPKKRTSVRALMDAVALEAMQAVQQGLMLRPDSVPTLETITVPVCVIAGGEDQSSTPAEMHVIAEKVPDAEFHLLEDAGHFAPFEQPEVVAKIIGDFLDAHYGEKTQE